MLGKTRKALLLDEMLLVPTASINTCARRTQLSQTLAVLHSLLEDVSPVSCTMNSALLQADGKLLPCWTKIEAETVEGSDRKSGRVSKVSSAMFLSTQSCLLWGFIV